MVQPAKGHVKAHVGSSNDSSVKGILQVARDLANSRTNSRDARTTIYVCFPHFFTHTIKVTITHKIVRRVS